MCIRRVPQATDTAKAPVYEALYFSLTSRLEIFERNVLLPIQTSQLPKWHLINARFCTQFWRDSESEAIKIVVSIRVSVSRK